MKKEIQIFIAKTTFFLAPVLAASNLNAKNDWEVIRHDPYATEEDFGVSRFDEDDDLDKFGDAQEVSGYTPVVPDMPTEGVVGWVVFNARRAGTSLALSLLSAKNFFATVKDRILLAWIWFKVHVLPAK